MTYRQFLFNSFRSLSNASNLLVFFCLSILFIVTPQMRPVSDDYCFAASLNNGPVESFSYWYSAVNFDLFGLISNLLFVATPILVLPIEVASKFTFFFALIIFSLFNLKIFVPQTAMKENYKRLHLFYFLVLSILMFFLSPLFLAWVLELIAGGFPELVEGFLLHASQHFTDVANSWIMWASANSYLYPFMFSFLIILHFDFLKGLNSSILLLLGFLVGTSGYVVAAATFVTIIYLQLNGKTKNYGIDNFLAVGKKLSPILFLVSLTLGVVFSFTSPGAFSRRDTIKSLNPVNLKSFTMIPIDSFQIVLELLGNIGIFSPIILGFYFGISRKLNQDILRRRAEQMQRIAIPFFIAIFGFTTVSEIFSYKAYWHYNTLKYLLFLMILSASIKKFCVSGSTMRPVIQNYLIILIFCISLVTILIAKQEIDNRHNAWVAGEWYGVLPPANERDSWVNGCYENLRAGNQQKYYPELKV